MSEEIREAAGDIAYWKLRAEQAEADAAALRRPLQRIADRDCIPAACYQIAEDALEADHLGAALLAELEAARAVVKAIDRLEINWPPLVAALVAYNAAVKARSE